MTIQLIRGDSFLLPYDNEGQGDAGAGAAVLEGGADGSKQGQEGNPGAGAGDGDGAKGKSSLFTQEQVNEFLASDRRNQQKKFDTQAGQLEQLRRGVKLTDEQRDALEQQIESLRTATLTEQERARREQDKQRKTFETTLEDVTVERDKWKGSYEEAVVGTAITNAAVAHDAWSTPQIEAILRPITRLVPILGENNETTGRFEPRVKLNDQDKEGKSFVADLTPHEAVARMKELSDRYGNLFKSGLKSGLGSGNESAPGGKGQVDVTKMDTDQYMKLRAENPGKLGLTRQRRI